MSISEKSIKLLWSAAGGRCSFPNCWQRLSFHESSDAAPYTLGEMAHICGEKVGANRHNASQTPKERDDYLNLILLCPTHHTLIDRKENESTYSVQVLKDMKVTHEAAVLGRMEKTLARGRREIFLEILQLLEENHQCWAKFGPKSEIARKQPYNQAAYLVWLSERLSVIVPNNRKIMHILAESDSVFNPNEFGVVSAFLMHVRSYEKWVQDEIEYASVVRFPLSFSDMIRGEFNGSVQ